MNPAKKAAKVTKATKAGKKVVTSRTKPQRPTADRIFWDLRLYIAGRTTQSVAALDHLKRLCEERLKGRYCLEIIDLLEHPELAKRDQILAIPTLVRKLPPPIKKIIGDLSDTERVLVGLEVGPRS